MIQHTMLKLYWANFTTAQLHHLTRTYPDFLSENVFHQHDMIKRWLTERNSERLWNKYERFKDLKMMDIIKEMKKANVSFTTYFDDNYPSLCKEMYDYPYVIFYKGNPQFFNHSHSLAVIGSRNATQYTSQSLNYLFPSFRQLNMAIVSGLARGADSVAHQTALKYLLPTIGVLGFGHCYHYPKATLNLRTKVERNGLVISEYPPFSPISKHKFPERNRLISGLSRGVLITEAEERSGSQITIDCALEQNRNVYVLPGSMFNKMTKGNLRRINEGAQVVIDESSILYDYLF